MKVLVINGPNLNMLGVREPEIYGSTTLADIENSLRQLAADLSCEVEFFQSNHEGLIVDRIQRGHGTGLGGAIINPGGLTHSSVSIHDAVKAVDYPIVEVHLSNLHKREAWRQHTVTSAAAAGVIQGLGWRGYELAFRWLVDRAMSAGIT